MTEVDFIIGAPNLSQRIIVMNTEKPSPRYSAEPQGSACGAEMLGHFAKKAEAVDGLAQGPEPPIQFWKPLSTR